MSQTYAIVVEGKAIKCLVCSRTSYHPEDVKRKYCGHCHAFHEDRRVAIWLDDLRSPTSSFNSGKIEAYAGEGARVCWVKTVPDFKEAFVKYSTPPSVVAGVFFDNDLGQKLEGRHAFNWMEEYVREHHIAPFALHAQTMNSAARRELNSGFEALRRWWETPDV